MRLCCAAVLLPEPQLSELPVATLADAHTIFGAMSAAAPPPAPAPAAGGEVAKGGVVLA